MKKIDNHTLFFGNYVDADLQLNDLREYLVDVKKFIDRKRRYREKRLTKSIFKDIALNMFTESFSTTLYDSVMISLWIFMESEFRGYCRAMQNVMGIKISFSDIYGSPIEKFKIYTQKVANLDFGLTNENWEDLKAINEIRNSIVHLDGVVKNKKLIENFIKRHKIKYLLEEDRIVLSKESLETIISYCRLVNERIYTVALGKYPKDKK
jgi:hypothetical protein